MTFLEKVRFALGMPPRVLAKALLNRGRRMLRRLVRRLLGRSEFEGAARAPARAGAALRYDQPITSVPGVEVRADGTVRLPAISLLTPFRFDIAAKCIYATHRLREVRSDFAQRLYLGFTQTWNGFYEFEPRKTTADDFVRSFDETIDSIVAHGFDPERSLVKVAYNGSPVDGAHRIAAAIAAGADIVCEVLPPEVPVPDYSWAYFHQHQEYVEGGLTREWADPAALEYVQLKPNCHVLIVYPSCPETAALDEALVTATLREFGAVVYDTSIRFTERGQLNLIRLVYEGEEWVGDESTDFLGPKWKASRCFASGDTVHVYLLEAASVEDVTAAKMAIRALFPAGQDAVHSTDTHEEALRAAGYLLNANSIDLINRAPARSFARFERLVTAFLGWIAEHGLDRRELCVDGSAVLAAYGVRDCADLDFLHHAGTYETGGDPEVRSHNEEAAHHHRLHRDEIIFDPAHHLYYRGLKFTSLAATLTMKRERDEEKDRRDLELTSEALGELTL